MASDAPDHVYSTRFTNEHGHEITLEISQEKLSDGTTYVTVFAEGPTSTCEHTWTWDEIVQIRKGFEMLDVPEEKK